MSLVTYATTQRTTHMTQQKKTYWQAVRVLLWMCLSSIVLLVWCGWSSTIETQTVSYDTFAWEIPQDMTSFDGAFVMGYRDSQSSLSLTVMPSPVTSTQLAWLDTLPELQDETERTRTICDGDDEALIKSYSFVPVAMAREYVTHIARDRYLMTITSNNETAHARFDDLRKTFVCEVTT